MSLVNAVHELIEVAAGRRNLSGVAADELHAAIDAEQAPAPPDPTSVSPAPGGTGSGNPSGAAVTGSSTEPPLLPASGPTTAGAPWPG